jgi:AraC-like DNA-binding protein
MRIWMNSGWVETPGGSTVLWTPGARHRYGVVSGLVGHTYVFVHGAAIGPLLRSLQLPVNQIVAGISADTFERHVFAIVQECLRPQAQDVVLENCVANLLHTIAAELATSGQRGADPRLLAVKRTLDLEFYRPQSLKRLSGIAHLSPAHLSDSFKRAFGKGPIEYAIGLRLSHARHLLRTTDMAVKEIAENAGYGDPYFFSRSFKKHCGKSPQEYRKCAADAARATGNS